MSEDEDITPPPSPTKKARKTPTPELSHEIQIAIQTIREACIYDNNGILTKYKNNSIDFKDYNQERFRQAVEVVEAQESLSQILATKNQ